MPEISKLPDVTISDCAAAVGAFFAGAFTQLDGWRQVLSEGETTVRPAELDARVEALVRPALTGASPLFVGAGFIAAPGYVRGRDIHFAWWLGPQAGNPLLGSSSAATRLDLATRAYTDYVHDFRTLEWYQVPQSTNQTHVTGPYVDRLCTCEYIFTLTMPVRIGEGTPMLGVVGADISVRHLESIVLPLFLAADRPLALVTAVDRVVVSTDPTLQVGQLASQTGDSVACSGLPFRVLVGPDRPPRF
ncbi:cache domain-containing protein [Cryobacterium sp. PH31-L1]|uniref:cache domain-containing protein n=1 Tax=Cryobacterium sp. PH31-L1 TaxID=3046199 RepID=UPI0024BB4D64|nr:cache domain-containing protein [Cryobacterium sp. PH31-L1]MDJ0376780.1 cache domain-containing protein [Cryobacterium sp. PH31-L1]